MNPVLGFREQAVLEVAKRDGKVFIGTLSNIYPLKSERKSAITCLIILGYLKPMTDRPAWEYVKKE